MPLPTCLIGEFTEASTAVESDEALLKALQQNQESAWEEAFRRLYPCAFSAARHPSAALSPSEAEDVAIEALTQLIPKAVQVKKFDELKALVVTIASRRALSWQRKKYAEKRGGHQTSSLDQIKEESAGLFEPPAPLLESLDSTNLLELSALLEEALASVDPQTQGLIADSLLHGMSYQELANKYQISVTNVGVLLHRGLKKVRFCLDQSPRLLKELHEFLR